MGAEFLFLNLWVSLEALVLPMTHQPPPTGPPLHAGTPRRPAAPQGRRAAERPLLLSDSPKNADATASAPSQASAVDVHRILSIVADMKYPAFSSQQLRAQGHIFSGDAGSV